MHSLLDCGMPVQYAILAVFLGVLSLIFATMIINEQLVSCSLAENPATCRAVQQVWAVIMFFAGISLISEAGVLFLALPGITPDAPRPSRQEDDEWLAQ